MRRTTHNAQRTTQIILALDVDTFSKAEYFVNLLYPKIKIFKVGLQLFTACGSRIVEFIHQKSGEVFLDLKFFDIPNTVANAVRQAVRLKVKMLTLHILGGDEMLRLAADAAQDESARLKTKAPFLIGVTVLTNRANEGNMLAQVLGLAGLAKKAGLAGVVCSAQEAGAIRDKLGADFIIVTPGIRLLQDKRGDQKRASTVQEAVKAGSNYLVIGRPILQAKDPLKAVKLLSNGLI